MYVFEAVTRQGHYFVIAGSFEEAMDKTAKYVQEHFGCPADFVRVAMIEGPVLIP